MTRRRPTSRYLELAYPSMRAWTIRGLRVWQALGTMGWEAEQLEWEWPR